jgi:hypothetical protein
MEHAITRHLETPPTAIAQWSLTTLREAWSRPSPKTPTTSLPGLTEGGADAEGRRLDTASLRQLKKGICLHCA